MHVNLDLLRVFQTPTTVYEISKCTKSRYYSGAHKAVKKLLTQELIYLASLEISEKNGTKKIYTLTEKGRQLLKLFPAEAKEASIFEH
jgi:DNA-binding PadR family transcriptional regulator